MTLDDILFDTSVVAFGRVMRFWKLLSFVCLLCLLRPVKLLSDSETTTAVTVPCSGRCLCSGTEVECSRLELDTLPVDISILTTVLDLSHNSLRYLSDHSFSRYYHLEELNLASNSLLNVSSEAFAGISRLRILNLRGNNLTSIPWHTFHNLHYLHELHLGNNQIHVISDEDFYGLKELKTLALDGNRLQYVPVEALRTLSNLEVLSLAYNNLSYLEDGSFVNLTSLKTLSLASNQIESIGPRAFTGLTSLQVLELQHNHLGAVPTAIYELNAIQKISVAFNYIRYVQNGIFTHNHQLIHADLLGNPVSLVEHNVFTNLTYLKILIIPEAKELVVFPDLNGTTSLEFLRIDRARIQDVPPGICLISHNLKTLDLKSNLLLEVPSLRECRNLRQLQLSGNQIKSLDGGLFRYQGLLHDLLLSNNEIQSLSADAFIGLHKLEILNLVGNQIKEIHQDAFLPLKQLVYLNVAENQFPQLPNQGLEHVRQLLAFNNPYLRDFPSPLSFPHVHTLKLAFAYHCCQFVANEHDNSGQSVIPVDLQDTVFWLPKDKVDLSLWAANTSDIWPIYQNWTDKFGDLADVLWGSLSQDYVYPSNLPQVVEDYLEEAKAQDFHRSSQVVSCFPLPGPFMPCEDLFDWWTLRCGIWIVFLLAMLGNGTVVFVLIFSRTKMDVPRFLVCNLACADFCMGVFLGFLAVVDASTLGQFKIYALQWQFSAACQVAGFLGVLSSELSVFTLAVITLERNYAITHAMHLNKRLSLKHASYIMGCGWLFAIVTAALPLVGISDYRKFAVCLPFDIEGPWALAYVVFLMAVNGVAFLILMGCYLKMYCAIRGSQAWNSNDSRIAKRMALLVFTDFICWAPIAFFSLTAAFGLQLVSLEEAKVFTIFVLPLNSCANPFLYAILTKQFKKDCVLICKAIEESRVTRGIGRCRHSSNFSNRQTPGNTNSAVDRNSNNGQIACSCSRGSSDGVGGGGTVAVRISASNNGGSSSSRVQDPEVHRRRRWQAFKMHFLLCTSSESEPSSANDYAYAIAEIQKNQQKHSRNLSVSSDNFSSSRSDSWRQNKSIPLRILDKGRRNSWTITRKPSQDSNLSSSRNDSSATTPSTSTWRVSRSSVSSDMSSGNMAQRATGTNLRERSAGVAPNGGASNIVGGGNAGGGGGVISLAGVPSASAAGGSSLPASGCNTETGGPSSSTIVRFTLPKNAATGDLDSDCVLLTSARPKAKLRRQSAVNDDLYSPARSVVPLSLANERRRLSEDGGDPRMNIYLGGGSCLSSADRLRFALVRYPAGRNLVDSGGAVFSRELFMPRKLSTISSNSCSLNQDSWSVATTSVQHANSSSVTSSGAILLNRGRSNTELERPSSLTNVASTSDGCVEHRRTLSDASFSHRRTSVPLVFSSRHARSSSGQKLSHSDCFLDKRGKRMSLHQWPVRRRGSADVRIERSSVSAKDTLRNSDGDTEPLVGASSSSTHKSEPPPYLEDDI